VSSREINDLTEDLKRFKAEKEKIRLVVGQIGGKMSPKGENLVNRAFIVLLIVLFLGDVARHFFKIHVPLPPLFSLEIGILLVSLKIIWMIRNQTRVEHFQFWMLTSIEFRLDQMSKRMRNIEKQVVELAPSTGEDKD
jgi:hypothetical protein